MHSTPSDLVIGESEDGNSFLMRLPHWVSLAVCFKIQSGWFSLEIPQLSMTFRACPNCTLTFNYAVLQTVASKGRRFFFRILYSRPGKTVNDCPAKKESMLGNSCHLQSILVVWLAGKLWIVEVPVQEKQ